MIKVFISVFLSFPEFLMYYFYDICIYISLKMYKNFYGWGIHLITGRFGAGKSSVMCKIAYDICSKYKHMSILSNLDISCFPDGVEVLKLETAQDILNAPNDCVVLIDEIGTIFNSRDFSSGKVAVPKILFQHLCQCRKRNMIIYGTVQKYKLLDKQIRDISADVTVCHSYFKHPFTRMITCHTYDVDDYDLYTTNPMYVPKSINSFAYVQRGLYRHLYDTDQLIDNMLSKDYISDDDIVKNRGDVSASLSSVSRRESRQVRFNRKG